MPCWEPPKPYWYPLVSAGSRAGAAEFPGTGCGFLVHLPARVEGFSQSEKKALFGEAELSVSLCVEPLLIPSLLFLAQQPRAVGFRVFFFFSVNSKSFLSFTFYSRMLPAPFGFDLH